jgi:hypothetical protein
MTTGTGEVFAHESLSSCDTAADQNYEHEQLSAPDDGADSTGDGVCTIYSIQAVSGIAVAGCMIAGLDYGRRP